MTIDDKNQNDIIDSKLIRSFEIDYIFNDVPINRVKNKPKVENKANMLFELKNKIEKVENCELKKNGSKIVFSDGDYNSQIMLVGEGPGQKEDEIGKPFVGDAGMLLNKMLNAININREKIYITNVVNYRPPNNRKPESLEIIKYSNFLREHISIINPKILITYISTHPETTIYIQNGPYSKSRTRCTQIPNPMSKFFWCPKSSNRHCLCPFRKVFFRMPLYSWRKN